nr:phage Gp37/Gp68 family protein [Brevibacillus brevis]
MHRIDDLRRVPAYTRFLSVEPLIGPIDNLNLEGIHWVIVGGESGPGARPMKEEWVRSIMQQCKDQNVAFFFKQWGGVQKHRNGRMIGGQTYDE